VSAAMLNSVIGVRNAEARARWVLGILTGVVCADPWASQPIDRAMFDLRRERKLKVAREWLKQRKIDKALSDFEHQRRVWQSLRSNVVAFTGIRR
jgi:hypothetical protein